ncbi:MAG: hypothetical protein QM655_05435 [Nocardioidaceae bacterium]
MQDNPGWRPSYVPGEVAAGGGGTVPPVPPVPPSLPTPDEPDDVGRLAALFVRRSIAGSGLLVVLAVGILITASSTPTAASQDTEEVTATVRSAILAQQQIGAIDAPSVKPAENEGNITADGHYPIAEKAELSSLTDEQIVASRTRSEQRIRQFFAGDQLEFELRINDDMNDGYQPLVVNPETGKTASSTDPSKTNSYILTGGADQFTFDSVSIDDGSATATGTTRTWLNEAEVRPQEIYVFSPSGMIQFTAHLSNPAGDTWQVDQFNWDFMPGSEP